MGNWFGSGGTSWPSPYGEAEPVTCDGLAPPTPVMLGVWGFLVRALAASL